MTNQVLNMAGKMIKAIADSLTDHRNQLAKFPSNASEVKSLDEIVDGLYLVRKAINKLMDSSIG